MTLLCRESHITCGDLRGLFAAATREASEAMRRWTNSPIELTLDEVRELPLEDACGRLGVGDEHFAMVAHTIDDVVGGTLVLMFDKDNGRRLAASLLGKGSQNGGGWSEMEISALTETGNILSCAYVNAITRLIDRRLVPSVPYFVSDYGASVLQQAFAAHASLRDAMLVCRTGFHHAGDELSWLLIFIPTIALREAMEDAFVHLP